MSGALAAVITYALLLVLWTIILALYVRHRRHAEGDSLIALLLTVLALDAFKSAFESAYFGTVWAANYGVLPASFKTLGEPWPLASVKLLNVAVASIVLFRLARFWVPQELQRREQQRIDLQATLKLARDNEETLRLAVSATSNFLWDTDLRTGRVTASGETGRWLGYPPEEWPPEPWDQIVHPEDAQRVAEAITAAIKGRTPNYDVKHRVRKKDGTAIQVHSTGVVARDAQGRAVRFVGSVRDVSREVEEEAARVQTQKLEGLGLLAGGIAHDFNNLLTVVTSSLELARSNTAADKKSEALDTAKLAVTRATVLTRQLLAYAGRASTEHVPLDLNELVGSMGDLLSVTVPRKVTVQRELEKTLPAVMGDPAQLQQVVMNLITNAGEAIGEKEGQVTLRTAAMTLDAPPPHLRTGTISGKVVRLTVTDTGHGMSSETQARIFDPFFSTKGTGRGLGLSALAGILKSHGGAICLDSAIGRGSTFTIYLPALDKPLEKPAAPPAAEREPLSLRVLLVDDEPLLRRSTRRLLELLGCTVEEAETGRQALERVRAHVTDFDVVLMDVTMPEMSGIEASEVLRELAPKLPVVLSTGYSAGGDLPDSSSDSGLFTLAKPYTLEQMERVLRKAANAK
ncbi:MAG: response regulator [Archangium sp.]|nr:response regulator [Archangium sp.]